MALWTKPGICCGSKQIWLQVSELVYSKHPLIQFFPDPGKGEFPYFTWKSLPNNYLYRLLSKIFILASFLGEVFTIIKGH